MTDILPGVYIHLCGRYDYRYITRCIYISLYDRCLILPGVYIYMYLFAVDMNDITWCVYIYICPVDMTDILPGVYISLR